MMIDNASFRRVVISVPKQQRLDRAER